MGAGCSFKGSEPFAKKFKVADLGFVSSLDTLFSELLGCCGGVWEALVAWLGVWLGNRSHVCCRALRAGGDA